MPALQGNPERNILIRIAQRDRRAVDSEEIIILAACIDREQLSRRCAIRDDVMASAAAVPIT